MAHTAERDPEAKALFQLTREMELLISGALVFALLQLPTVLDDWWSQISLHVGGSSFFTVFIVYYIGKLVAYGLIVAISAHFLLRGFWVALMSLRSVYSGGIDLDKLDQGRIYRTFYEQRLISLYDVEDRVDRIAASIFAFVFLFLLLFLTMSMWAAGAWVFAILVAKLTGNDAWFVPIVLAFFVIFLGLQMLVALADKISKKRELAPRTQQAALSLLRVMHYLSFNFVYAPVFFTFSTRTSRRRMSVLLVSFMYAMIGAFMVSLFLSRGLIGFDSYSYYPQRAPEAQLRPLHYDNLRDAGAAVTAPSIQSELIEGPYLRLFVPYDAREDNDRMRKLCPDVPPVRSEGLFVAPRAKMPKPRVDALASCFDRLYRIEVDGKRVEKPGFVFFRHPQGNIPGRLALIPVSSLAAGHHLLTVKHAPLPGKQHDDDANEFYLPFWR
jgi:hypothetical protein